MQPCSAVTVTSASCTRVRRGPSRCSWRTWATWTSSRAWTAIWRVRAARLAASRLSLGSPAHSAQRLSLYCVPNPPPRVQVFSTGCTSSRRRRSVGTTFQFRSSSSSRPTRKWLALHPSSYTLFLHSMLVRMFFRAHCICAFVICAHRICAQSSCAHYNLRTFKLAHTEMFIYKNV